jgi:hypothetical protein
MSGILAHTLIAVREFFAGLSGRWSDLSAAVEGYLGPIGPWVLWGVAAFFALFFISKAAKFAFDLLRLVVLPSAALSVALTMLVPCWAPMKTFPALLAVTTAMMFLRSR